MASTAKIEERPLERKPTLKDDAKTKEELKEEAFLFGEKGDFWKQYCAIAETFDKDMTARMNSNLENLLIFAGLFSAVNSAFIVLTVGNLTPDPADQTNALLQLLVAHFDNTTIALLDPSAKSKHIPSLIRQNCVFFASLCSSLLAATGAVLAKQWLQVYERTGQTGPLYEQGLRRTEKFYGAKHWKLRPVVESLPTLLLISLALFFVALADYLWTINTHVAVTVTSFASTGAAFFLFTVIMAAIFPRCPFQTAISAGLRKWFVGAKKTALLPAKKVLLPAYFSYLMNVMRWLLPTTQFDRLFYKYQIHRNNGMEDEEVDIPLIADVEPHSDVLSARSAIWMIETAPESQNVLTVAMNIPALLDIKAVKYFSRSGACEWLIHRFGVTLLALQNKRTDRNVENTRVCARALVHILLADPGRWDKEVMEALTKSRDLDWEDSPRWLSSPDLMILCLFLIHLCFESGSQYPNDTFKSLSYPFIESVNQGTVARISLSHSAAITFLEQFVLYERVALTMADHATFDIERVRKASSFCAGRLSELLSMKSVASSNVLLSLTSLALLPVLGRLSTKETSMPDLSEWDQSLKLAWLTRDDTLTELLNNILRVLAAYERYFNFIHSAPDSNLSIELLQCQMQLLLRLGRLYPSWRSFYVHHPSEEVNIVATAVLANLRSISRLLDSRREGQRPSLDDAAVRALRSCKKELLHHLKSLTNPSHRAVDGGDEASLYGEVGDEDKDEAVLTPVLDMFANMNNTSHTTPTAEVAKFLAKALKVDLLANMELTKELVRRVLFVNSPRRFLLHEPDPDVSLIFLEERSGAPLLDVFLGRLWKGIDVRQLDWWIIIWLARAVQDNPVWGGRLEARVLKLFRPAMNSLTETRNSSPGEQIDQRVLSLGVLFLEVWGTTERGVTGSPWTSDEVIKAFASFLNTLDDECDVSFTLLEKGYCGRYLRTPARRYELHMNHQRTFHYIEHAISTNPAASLACGLHKLCAELIQKYAGDRTWGIWDDEPDDIRSEVREAARRALEAQRFVGMHSRIGQSPQNWPTFSCETCQRQPASEKGLDATATEEKVPDEGGIEEAASDDTDPFPEGLAWVETEPPMVGKKGSGKGKGNKEKGKKKSKGKKKGKILRFASEGGDAEVPPANRAGALSDSRRRE